MTTLRLKTTALNFTRMHLGGITPTRLSALSIAEITQLEIQVDEQPQPLGEWWEVSRPTAAASPCDVLHLEGDCSRCDGIGGGMQGGILEVHGNVGDDLGEGMRSGTLIVHGHAGRFAAAELRGGQIEIHGNAGEYAAAAAPGQSRGMRGGLLIVHGACDRWLGARMRRGMVIARGPVAAGCAARMLAGTIVLSDTVESPLGCGMRRGTIIMTAPTHVDTAQLLPGFTVGEQCELSYLPLLWNAIAKHLPPHTLPQLGQERPLRSLGDRTQHGLGECIWFQGPATAQASGPANCS
jgi:formylmethanofuran dehydrogenase subunit C